MIYIRNYCCILILISGVACTSFQTNPVLKRHNVTLLSISDKVYPAESSKIREEVLPPVPFPKWDQETIINILGNIKYKREKLWGKGTGQIYSDAELVIISDALSEAIKKIKPDERLVLINKHDPDTSILSKTHMNSTMLWVDEKGLNLVFGVIHEELPEDDFHDSGDWDNIVPISLRASYKDLEILPADFITFKKINGFVHKTWVIIPVDKISTLKYVKKQPEKKETLSKDEKEVQSQKKDTKKSTDPTTRLRKLKKAHDEKLISDEEYNQKRQSILDEF